VAGTIEVTKSGCSSHQFMRLHFISEHLPSEPLSFHHELTLKPARELMEEWDDVVSKQCRRCRLCWLRSYDCYCHYLKDQALQYQTIASQYSSSSLQSGTNLTVSPPEEPTRPSITVTIYYHYHEIGRSANTMHILEILCPTLCRNLILGDIDQETQLLQRILKSQDDERHGKKSRKIAVLYPSTDSVIIPTWLQQSRLKKSLWLGERDGEILDEIEEIEIIVLDATYGQATRLVR
jgi:hypothetical protein